MHIRPPQVGPVDTGLHGTVVLNLKDRIVQTTTVWTTLQGINPDITKNKSVVPYISLSVIYILLWNGSFFYNFRVGPIGKWIDW